MGHRYRQLDIEERCEIARLSAEGRSLGQIAAALDRAPSSIGRELKRNRGAEDRYNPGFAQQQARARRWSGSRLDRDAVLRESVLSQLAQGWSPGQIVGRSRRDGKAAIGVETIYRFIYARSPATRTIVGGTICPGPSSGAAGAAARAAVRPCI